MTFDELQVMISKLSATHLQVAAATQISVILLGMALESTEENEQIEQSGGVSLPELLPP